MSESQFTKEEHKKFAVALFNLTWSLLDKKDRTKDDDEKMLNAAHASDRSIDQYERGFSPGVSMWREGYKTYGRAQV